MGWHDDIPPALLAETKLVNSSDFTCAICLQWVDTRWNRRGPDTLIPPICNPCERVSGYDWAGRARYRSKPCAGSHMDRRNVTRILALADALQTEATRMEWSAKHAA